MTTSGSEKGRLSTHAEFWTASHYLGNPPLSISYTIPRSNSASSSTVPSHRQVISPIKLDLNNCSTCFY